MNRGFIDKKGMISMVLHAHLPFVRHPEYESFLEESWLFEALSETYLPLLRVFKSLEKDSVPFKMVLSISPTLVSMLKDEFLQERYISHVEKLIELADKELLYTQENEPAAYDLALMYRDLFVQNLKDYTETYERNLVKELVHFQKKGNLELITTTATHAFLPCFREYPEMIKAQILAAVELHDSVFGVMPDGLWLPECGYFPGLEEYLKPFGLRYFISASHGILYADERPELGVYGPLSCPNGVAVFGRDKAASRAVWSTDDGYPGNSLYRDFYRDIGFDRPRDYIDAYTNAGNRVNTGFKYYAITDKTDLGNKNYYDIKAADLKVREDAADFVQKRVEQIDKLSSLMDRKPIIICPYDAELFGHWWFEGPKFIEEVFRGIATSTVVSASPIDYLDMYPHNQKATPAFSSWGDKGYGQVWVDGSNDWIYRHLHKLIERMIELVDRYPDESGLKERALNQAAREVLLSQASDWPFIMKTGTTVPYAVKRVKTHIHNFNFIYESLCRNVVKTEWLTKLEKSNNIFPGINYRMFGRDYL
jgi:1,4-alpha-glucan branching enzyme